MYYSQREEFRKQSAVMARTNCRGSGHYAFDYIGAAAMNPNDLIAVTYPKIYESYLLCTSLCFSENAPLRKSLKKIWSPDEFNKADALGKLLSFIPK